VDSRIKQLFERYEKGVATPQERQLVEEWFASLVNNNHDFSVIDGQKAGIFNYLDKQIDNALGIRKVRRLPFGFMKIAAMLLLTLGAGLIGYRLTHQKKTIAISYSILSAGAGVKKQFLLADGSTVFLNSGSSLKVPSDFGINTRSVSLSGEAFFDIKHDAAKPFTITAGKTIVKDLGTSFDVNAYPDENHISIAVASGRVSAAQNNRHGKLMVVAASLTRGQQFVYDYGNHNYSIRHIPGNDIAAWKSNRMIFDNASFDEIATIIERWYNVKVSLNGSAGCRRYTISFNNEPIDKVMNVMKRLSGMSYRIDNKNVWINTKNCKKL
jgi:ferric-dicitrate binding protein FerR (iron transport regulator)